MVEYDAITCKLLAQTTARSEITNIMALALVKLFQILITLCSAMRDMMLTTDERRRTSCKRQKHLTLQFSICGREGESNYPELPGPGEPHYIVKLGEDGQTCRPSQVL